MKWLLTALCLAWTCASAAQESFVVEDIEIVGLQRITDGAVFNYLPVNIGDELTPQRAAQAMRALFDTTFFHDVELRRDGNTLIVTVVERPTIASFSVSGNKDIEDEDMRDVLRGVGLAEGRIFNRAVLDNVELELRRQYFNRGKYGMRVDTSVTDLANNMVAVTIVISEGEVALIKDINFVGNERFSDARLRREMELSKRNWLSWFRQDDQYSREKLEGDLESVSSYYMNQGYADFNINSVQVAISPDKQHVFVTVNVAEGDLYTIGTVELGGNMIVDEADLRPMVLMKEGDVFNRGVITTTTEWLSSRLGEEGYAQARITPVPDVDEENRIVNLLLFFEPGNRVYVRRINFTGGTTTNDETFRREMRQQEGGWLRTSAIERSKTRLQRLPWVESVEIETVPVPGAPDLADIDVEIKERTPGNFNVGLGYSGGYGLMLNAGVTHANFLGEGKRANIDLNRSSYSEHYRFGFTDPYSTVNGIGRTWGVFFQEADQIFARGSPLFMNSYGANLSYSIPITEFNAFNVGLAVRQTELIASVFSSDQMIDWVQEPGHGNNFEDINETDPFLTTWGTRFKTLELTGGWAKDTRNRGIFPSAGSLRRFAFEVAVPPSEVRYGIGTLLNQSYFPVTGSMSLMVRSELNVGTGFGDTRTIPPYKHFYAGGPDSVRGFRENWLGPRDSLERPFGGNIRVSNQTELVMTPPWERMQNSMRFSLFYDVGNVFVGRKSFDVDELRMSTGLSVSWLAPMGLIRISYAYPINDEPGDEVETFQFSLGSSF